MEKLTAHPLSTRRGARRETKSGSQETHRMENFFLRSLIAYRFAISSAILLSKSYRAESEANAIDFWRRRANPVASRMTLSARNEFSLKIPPPRSLARGILFPSAPAARNLFRLLPIRWNPLFSWLRNILLRFGRRRKRKKNWQKFAIKIDSVKGFEFQFGSRSRAATWICSQALDRGARWAMTHPTEAARWRREWRRKILSEPISSCSLCRCNSICSVSAKFNLEINKNLFESAGSARRKANETSWRGGKGKAESSSNISTTEAPRIDFQLLISSCAREVIRRIQGIRVWMSPKEKRNQWIGMSDWCRRVEVEALRLLPHLPLTLSWEPFDLNPLLSRSWLREGRKSSLRRLDQRRRRSHWCRKLLHESNKFAFDSVWSQRIFCASLYEAELLYVN